MEELKVGERIILEVDSLDWYKAAINDTFNYGKDAVNNLSDKELLSEFNEIE